MLLRKIVFIVAASISIQGHTNPSCTKQIEGYLSGLEHSVASPYLNEASKHIAKEKIAKIQSLRATNSDCEVKKEIEIFNILDNALDAANNASKTIK